jgi:hypothetical protein
MEIISDPQQNITSKQLINFKCVINLIYGNAPMHYLQKQRIIDILRGEVIGVGEDGGITAMPVRHFSGKR